MIEIKEVKRMFEDFTVKYSINCIINVEKIVDTKMLTNSSTEDIQKEIGKQILESIKNYGSDVVFDAMNKLIDAQHD